VHELSLVASVFEVLEEQAREHGASRVTRVVLKIGRLSGAVPDLVASAFEVYKRGTLAEDARLEIVDVPIAVRCQDCGAEAAGEDASSACAACGSRRIEIVAGRELVVETIDLLT
jgi:hydrogenase nickel incorporation protein HypA/HybF